VGCLVLVAGCGGGAPPGDAGAAPGFNATDVMFLQMMVPHHQQGLEIVRLVRSRPVPAEFALLAGAIEATQADEVKTMAGWLRDWAQPAAADPESHAAHGGMPGTSPAEIAALRAAGDADFERLAANLLIAHQDDAVQTARMETMGGVNGAARQLANSITLSRTAQIQQLLTWTTPR